MQIAKKRVIPFYCRSCCDTIFIDSTLLKGDDRMGRYVSSHRQYLLRTVLMIVVNIALMLPVMSASAADEADTEQYAKEIAVMVNEARAANGLPPMYISPYLMDVAHLRASESVILIDDKHHRPDGSKWSTAIDRNIAPYIYAAENLAAAGTTPTAVMAQWQASPRHWAAILSTSPTHMGVGVVYDPASRYRWYWILDMIQYSGEGGVMEGQYIPQKYDIVPKSCGDINGDGVVDTFDYVNLTVYLEKQAAGEPVSYNDLQMEAADCLKDGQVTIADAKALQRYLLGEYTALPYEF